MKSMKKKGFTVFELMIVLAIVAILAAIAIPSYQGSVRKSRRAEAQTQLIGFAGVAERIFTQTNSYTTVVKPTNNTAYLFSFPVAVTAQTYTIRATPINGQIADGCGTMTMTNTGLKTYTGSEANCW